jgi:hypothetical protein
MSIYQNNSYLLLFEIFNNKFFLYFFYDSISSHFFNDSYLLGLFSKLKNQNEMFLSFPPS